MAFLPSHLSIILTKQTNDLGFAAAATIPAAQSLVSLSFEDPTARIRAFGVWGASGSLGFV